MAISLGDECTVMHIHKNKVGKLQKKLGRIFAASERLGEGIYWDDILLVYICEKDI